MENYQMIVGLVLGVALLIGLTLKTKVHTFLALIISASVVGVVGGMEPVNVVNSIKAGFGSTLGSIGIVIGFGVMIGRILEVSGAAEKMAFTFIKYLGKGKEDWALAMTGFIVSIPIFADSGFVILTPLVKALSSKTGKSVVGLGIPLATGLIVTHHLVPPTPGPLGVAGIFGADVGQVILWGIIFSIPPLLTGVFYAKWLGKKIHQVPDPTGLSWTREKSEVSFTQAMKESEKLSLKKGPSVFLSFLPIIGPIILIFLNTLVSALKMGGYIQQITSFFGNPIIAMGIGLVLAIYTLSGNDLKEDVLKRLEEGVSSSGIILLITGAGGALGYVIRESGIGSYIAELIAASSIYPILIPFAIATIIRLIQGSGTVSMITAASISAPILANLNISPVFATMSACMGAMVFSYFNDSFFWVVNRMLGIIKVEEQIKVWSIPTTICWAICGVCLMVVNAIFS